MQFVVRIPRVKYTWNRNSVLTFLSLSLYLPLLPFFPHAARGHINILDSFNKGVTRFARTGRLDYVDASSQIDYLYRAYIRLKAESIDSQIGLFIVVISYQIVALNMGIRGCSVLEGRVHEPARIFDVPCESIRAILDCPEINCGF